MDEAIQKGGRHLSKCDVVLARLIVQYEAYTIRPHKNYYQALVDEIIGQQLSVKAAAAIRKRFAELVGSDTPSPVTILSKSVEDYRAVGLSRAKAAYIRDLAQHVIDGKVKFDHLDSLSNEKIIGELTGVKGIGEWTAHMFLIFCMGRLDVLAYGDLGIKNGIQKLYGLDHLPLQQEIQELAETNAWHPYESIACWYIWQSLDNTPIVN